MEKTSRPAIDRLDLRLLDILQRRGALSVAEVAAQTRLSTTTCWRRIQQLEQNGVIKARVALLDRNALGLDVTIFAHVKLATTGRDAIAEFEAAIRDRAEVLECYTLTGEWDFLLKIVTKNIKAYEAFYLDYLSRIPCVRSVNSSVAVTVIKESTALCPDDGTTVETLIGHLRAGLRSGRASRPALAPAANEALPLGI